MHPKAKKIDPEVAWIMELSDSVFNIAITKYKGIWWKTMYHVYEKMENFIRDVVSVTEMLKMKNLIAEMSNS